MRNTSNTVTSRCERANLPEGRNLIWTPSHSLHFNNFSVAAEVAASRVVTKKKICCTLDSFLSRISCFSSLSISHARRRVENCYERFFLERDKQVTYGFKFKRDDPQKGIISVFFFNTWKDFSLRFMRNTRHDKMWAIEKNSVAIQQETDNFILFDTVTQTAAQYWSNTLIISVRK